MLSLVLYPYVYLLARTAFLQQSVGVIEVSRSLNCSPWQSFYWVGLPLARPAVAAGLSLALMETLADYGTVAYFGLKVFTTGIFRTWFGLGDYSAASRMAAMLLLFVFILIIIERVSRNKAKFHNTSGNLAHYSEYSLKGLKAYGAFSVCAIPLFLGFLLPATQLLVWALETWREMMDDRFFEIARNSIVLGFSAALVSVIVALFLGYGKRILPEKMMIISVRTASIGYALPGTVIAVGVIIPFAWFDRKIDSLMSEGYGTIVIKNPQGKHSLGVGILNKLNLIFEGSLGYFGVGSIDGPIVRVNGRVGWSCAENMMAGKVVIEKNAGSCFGAAIRGGDLICKGSVGARTGIDQKGGSIIVGGDAGAFTGFMMQRGRIVVLGDVGINLGDSMYDGTIYVGGKIGSFGSDAVEAPMTKNDIDWLNRKLKVAEIGENFDVSKMTKVVAGKKLWNYDALEPTEKKGAI